jgi:hypothetical protein
MRMSQYYLSLLVLSILGLVATALGGVLHRPWHLSLALPTAMLVVGMHSLVIVFVMIGGRLLREASNNCGLSHEYLEQSNVFFKDRTGLFFCVAGAFSIVIAAVLGYGNRAFGLAPDVHLIAGVLAGMVSLAAAPFELKALQRTEALLDTTRETLDTEDRDRAARGLGPVDERHIAYKDSKAHIALFIVIAPWLIYLYQVLIVWQGDFGRVSLHPWVEASAVGLILWIRAKRRPEPGSQS